MRKSCPICGRIFAAPPSGAKTCSHVCADKLKSRSHQGVPRDPWRQDRAMVARNLPRLRQRAAENRERIMANPRNRRGPAHHAAGGWVLRDPDGRLWQVTDLKDWARSHAHLFGQEDGEKGAVRVCAGIQQIKRSMMGLRPDAVTSYRGWGLVSWSGRLDRP